MLRVLVLAILVMLSGVAAHERDPSLFSKLGVWLLDLSYLVIDVTATFFVIVDASLAKCHE